MKMAGLSTTIFKSSDFPYYFLIFHPNMPTPHHPNADHWGWESIYLFQTFRAHAAIVSISIGIMAGMIVSCLQNEWEDIYQTFKNIQCIYIIGTCLEHA